MSERALLAQWSSLRAGGRTALIPYLTAGYPDGATTVAALRAVEEAGADIVELGMPFSDPLADGPVIQASTQAALAKGMTIPGLFSIVEEARLSIPIVAFGYLNPVLQYGPSRFAEDAGGAGLAGLLLTDVPLGEGADLKAALGPDLPFIPLVAPTTSDARLAVALPGADGFVYVIARLGVTGPATTVDDSVRALVRRVRVHSDLPVALGFGIASPAQAAAAASIADGVVVGSAVVARLDQGVDAVAELVGELRSAIDQVG